jgi:hypothetical protein
MVPLTAITQGDTMKRSRIPRRQSKRVFKKGTAVHKKNSLRNAPDRGGIRL